jgi:hypothetical protein
LKKNSQDYSDQSTEDRETPTLREPLRFTFARDGSLLWIADRDHPTSVDNDPACRLKKTSR